MKTYKYIFLFILFSCTACSDFLEEDTRGKQMQKTFYNTDREIEGGIMGLYDKMTSSNIHGKLVCMTEACSDLLTYKPVAAALGMSFPRYVLTPENTFIADMWNSLYKNLFGINSFIQAIEENTSPNISSEVKSVCLKEAKFFRALCYYHLIMCWGDVPFRTDPTNMSKTDIERTPKKKIWELVVSDLNEAINLPDKTQVAEGRISKGTAQTLLAKVYMTLGQMQEAKNVLDQITGYSLMPDIKQVWSITHKYNNESIWEINKEEGTLPRQSNNRLPFYMPMHKDFKGTNATYPVNDYVLLMTEENSPRTKYFYSIKPLSSQVTQTYKGEYVYTNSEGNDVKIVFSNATVPLYSHIMKFVDFTNHGSKFTSKDCPFNVIVFRYADVVLMKAEVECELNGKSEVALDYLNQIRNRAGESLYSFDNTDGAKLLKDKDELREAIRNERALELIGEGHRFYDLKRWGTEYALKKIRESRQAHVPNTEFCYKPEDLTNILEEKLLWPIPESEMNANSLMIQNPGYN